MSGGDRPEDRILDRAVARLRAGIMAIVFGSSTGVILFLATVWLLIRGGEDVGLHLNLLGHYFPGYSVSWPGAFVGFLYGSVTGALLGGSIAWVYNRASRRPSGPGTR